MKLTVISLIALSGLMAGYGRAQSQPPLIASNEELFEKARVASLELYLKFYAAQTVLEQTEVTSQLLRNEQLTISKDLWAMTPKLQQDAETAYKNWITTIPNTSYSPHTLRIKYEDAIWNYISTCRYRNPDGSNSPEKIVKAKDDEDIAYESWVDSLPNKTDPYKTYTKNGSETGYSHDEKRP
jgi:hypothetical protein